jgi:hypothetical protein
MDGKCSARNKDGTPCGAAAWKDALCRWHHPDLEQQRAEGRRRGGMAKSNKARAKRQLPEAMSHDELLGFVSLSIKGVLGGKVEPGVANAVANLARAFVTVAGVAEFEQQLAELRRDVADIAERRRA